MVAPRLGVSSAPVAAADDETGFREWALERAMAANRVAFLSASATCALVWAIVTAFGAPDPFLHASFAWMFACFAGGLYAVRRRDRRSGRWYAAVTNVSGGIFAVYAAWSLSEVAGHGIVVATGVFMALFVQGAHRDEPWIATVPALATTACVEVLLVLAWRSGTLSVLGLAIESGLLGASAAVGAMFLRANDAYARDAYRQERVIEQQKATIAAERARTEELLKREVAHQVAERSRELGAVLARSDVTLDARRLGVGERFAERYKVVATLGAGGMGAVYEVERVTDAARLALKAVAGEVSGASAARFAREAEIGARLRHPNLISIVDVGVSSGVPFLVMDLVRGGSLERERSKFGDVPWALPILRQITEGLAALHEAGVVHRDLKPANVLLDGGIARISDFGISRFGGLDDAVVNVTGDTIAAARKKSAELTGTGVVMGTPLYMAPEGARSARALDASADVFALGIMAYEMLTGRPPFQVPAFVLAMAEQPTPEPAPIEDTRVPSALRDALRSALALDPARRPRGRALLALFG